MVKSLDFSLINDKTVGTKYSEGKGKNVIFKEFIAESTAGGPKPKRKIDLYDYLHSNLSAIEWILKDYIPRGMVTKESKSLCDASEELIKRSRESTRKMLPYFLFQRNATKKSIELIREAYLDF